MDKIIINTDFGKEEYEIVMTFKIEEYNSDYIIYRKNNDYYCAKFIVENDITKLTTDLSEQEKEKLSEMFEKFKKVGMIRC